MANAQDAVSTAPFVDDDADESKAYEAQDDVESQSDTEDGSADADVHTDADALSKLIKDSVLEALETNAQDNTKTNKEGTQMANKLRKRATDDDAVLEDAQTADEVLGDVVDQGVDFDKAEDEAGKDTGSGVTVDNGDNEAGSEDDASDTDALKPVTTAEAMRLADKYIKAGVIKEASRYDAISKFSKLTRLAAHNQLNALAAVAKANNTKSAKLAKMALRKNAEVGTYEIEGVWHDMSQADMPAGVDFVSVRPNDGTAYPPAGQYGCEDILTVRGDYDTIFQWVDSHGYTPEDYAPYDFIHKVARRKPVVHRANRKRASLKSVPQAEWGEYLEGSTIDDVRAVYVDDSDPDGNWPYIFVWNDGHATVVDPYTYDETDYDSEALAKDALAKFATASRRKSHRVVKHVSALIDSDGIVRGTLTRTGSKFAWKLADQTEDANEAGKPTEGEADSIKEALEDASDAFDNVEDSLEEATEKTVEKASNRRAMAAKRKRAAAKSMRANKRTIARRNAHVRRNAHARTPRLASANIHTDDKLALL